ncbi:hypothetical protein K1T71_000431 [Dendrolimus kikuchii]|uniref:Uncharacterized protein n=1 Tax=Dendrolimus kikuchii TaxID=765133 RepID=A0ACC1DJ61_9NEOP|nr:hypothetical protein K1T71_000431 [Dendrolimus kikuchii]
MFKIIIYTVSTITIYSLLIRPLEAGQDIDYSIYKSTHQERIFSKQILALMKNYVDDAQKRTNLLRKERLMFEESPQYEIGYLMSEVIERYRRAVEHTKMNVQYKSTYPFDALRKLQHVEIAYYEGYHLVQMMHEIVRKYWYEDEFDQSRPSKPRGKRETQVGLPAPNIKEMLENIKKREKQRKKEMKKFYKKNRGQNNTVTRKKIYNKYWPIDYGWELQYDW